MNAETIAFQIAKLTKSFNKRELAKQIVELEAKLRLHISQSNRYYEVIQQRDATIRDMTVRLNALGVQYAPPRAMLMQQAKDLATKLNMQVRINELGTGLEIYREGAWEAHA